MALGRGISLRAGQLDQHVLNWTWPQASPGGKIDPYCEDQESKAIGISLDRDVFTSDATIFTNAFWTVKWSAGNLTQTVELDVSTGTFMTVFGSMVSISCSYPLPDGADPTIPINVRAVLGFDGGRQSPGVTSVPKRTIRIGNLNVGNISLPIPIPRFAVAVAFADSSFDNVAMDFIQSNSQNIGAGNIVNRSRIGKLDQDSVPIVNSATHVALVNNAVDNSTNLSLVFYLAV